MTIREQACSVGFSDSKGSQISMRLRSERDGGTEEPGWFVSDRMQTWIYSGPLTTQVDKHFLCLEQFAVQMMPDKKPCDRIAWIPLLDRIGTVVGYLHLYNRYRDNGSKPTQFRITDRGETLTYDL